MNDFLVAASATCSHALPWYRFMTSSWILTPTSSKPSGLPMMMGGKSPLIYAPLPCAHCGDELDFVGVFPAWSGRLFGLWQCFACLPVMVGNHEIKWLMADDHLILRGCSGMRWLEGARAPSLPGPQHFAHNRALANAASHSNLPTQRQLEPFDIQTLGWSHTFTNAIDPLRRKQPRSTRLLIQIKSDKAIDFYHSGLFKYFYCPIKKQTVLDYEPIQ